MLNFDEMTHSLSFSHFAHSKFNHIWRVESVFQRCGLGSFWLNFCFAFILVSETMAVGDDLKLNEMILREKALGYVKQVFL